MLGISTSNDAGVGQGTTRNGPLIVNGGTGGWVLWCASAMNLDDQNSNIGTVAEQAQRTASTCYMRGLSEHIRVQTSSASPWFWRRLVFTCKGNTAFGAFAVTPLPPIVGPYFDGTSGIQRLLYNSNAQTPSQTPTINAQQTYLFKGVSGVDWNDPILAPVDTARVTLLYDKTVTLKSGNQSGTIREPKMYHSFNKNLRYDDDENGSVENSSYFSTDSKMGMGDIYVLDQFSTGVGGGASDLLSFNVNSTLYWHER